MNKKLIIRTFGIISLSASSFYLGSQYEHKKFLKEIEQISESDPYLFYSKNRIISNFSKKPALPIFGEVSAATPIPYEAPASGIASRISQIMKYGFPGLDHVRSYSDYVLSYDRRNRVAHWVFEHITPENVQRNNEVVDRAKCQFIPDDSIHPYFRSDNADYKKSGYDRGHLAAAGNHKKCQKHCDETFYLSNMAPQVGQGFNRDSWNRLERYVRKLTKIYPNVYVCTGPLYLPKKGANGKMFVSYEVIGNNHVAVPTHFFKIIVGETTDNKLELESYVMPNQAISDDTPLTVYQVAPDVIERSAGLLFFDKIARKQLAKINGKKT